MLCFFLLCNCSAGYSQFRVEERDWIRLTQDRERETRGMSLTAATLQQHDARTGGFAAVSIGASSGSAHATCAPSRRSLTSMAPRPSDQLGCILGFGATAAQVVEKSSRVESERASSHAVAVGHGSVRPARSQRSRQSVVESDLDDVTLESLEAQLEEERAGRRSLEEKVEGIARMIERLGSCAQTAPTAKGAQDSALCERATNKGNGSACTNRKSSGRPPVPASNSRPSLKRLPSVTATQYR